MEEIIDAIDRDNLYQTIDMTRGKRYNWDVLALEAAKVGSKDITMYLISKGATNLYELEYTAYRHGHYSLYKLLNYVVSNLPLDYTIY